MNFPAIPDSGARRRHSPIPNSDALTHGVGCHRSANGVDGELNTEVAAFGAGGQHVYVGGNFRYVQRSTATGTGRSSSPSSPRSTWHR